jgi:hypothetical protein
MTPLELVQSTSPTVNAAGNAFYFAPPTLERGKELGLDGFQFYVLGRGGVLGDVEPDVIVSAFGYFAPGIVETIWGSAKQIMEPREGARAYLAAADEFGRSKLGDVVGLAEFNAAAEQITADVDRAALAVFAGIAAEPLPADAAARAYRNVILLRELRGSVHLVAIVANGLRPAVAHAIRRPDDVAMFGWDPAPTATDEDRAAWDRAEVLTDSLLARWYSVLDDEQSAALASGVEAIADAIRGPLT